MALTVSEVRDLPVAEAFRLVAGAAGLNRVIEHVNLLDFEYDTWEPKAQESDGIFDEKSIIVTSLLFAKNHPEKIICVVRQLYVDGISALAVKAVYYQELPKEVIDFANEKALPIFLFDSEKNFSENVVVGLTAAIEEHDNIEGLEEKLGFLLQENLGTINRVKISEELFPGLVAPYQCYYFLPKNVPSTFSYQHKILSLRRQKEKNIVVLPYQYGILVTVYGNNGDGLQELTEHMGLSVSEYFCGVSKCCKKKEEIAYKIKESLYASSYGRIHGKESCCFEEMGFWQIILPNRENYWMKSYCRGLMEKVRSYDMDGSSELYETLVCYVKNGCDVNRTAENMVVHKNTVRYRIGKVREVLEMEGDDSGFNEIIFFAVYFEENME